MFGKALAVLAGLLLFLFVLSRVDLGSVLNILYSAKLIYLFAALGIIIFLLVLKGAKWMVILSSLNVSLPLHKCIKYYCIGFFLSSITPGRVGDFSRALYVKEKATLAGGIGSVVLDRIFDILLLGFLALLASFFSIYAYGFSLLPIPFLIFGLGVFLVVFFMLLNPRHAAKILRPFFVSLVPENLKQGLLMHFRDFSLSMEKAKKRKQNLVFVTLITAFFWLLQGVLFFLLAYSLHINLLPEMIFLVLPIVSLADMLPTSVSGLGAREALLVLYFGLIGFSAEEALAFSLLIFVTSYVLLSAIGYLMFLSEPIELKTIFRKDRWS